MLLWLGPALIIGPLVLAVVFNAFRGSALLRDHIEPATDLIWLFVTGGMAIALIFHFRLLSWLCRDIAELAAPRTGGIK